MVEEEVGIILITDSKSNNLDTISQLRRMKANEKKSENIFRSSEMIDNVMVHFLFLFLDIQSKKFDLSFEDLIGFSQVVALVCNEDAKDLLKVWKITKKINAGIFGIVIKDKIQDIYYSKNSNKMDIFEYEGDDSFLRLPNDIIEYIFSFLRDMESLTVTCRRFHRILLQDHLKYKIHPAVWLSHELQLPLVSSHNLARELPSLARRILGIQPLQWETFRHKLNRKKTTFFGILCCWLFTMGNLGTLVIGSLCLRSKDFQCTLPVGASIFITGLICVLIGIYSLFVLNSRWKFERKSTFRISGWNMVDYSGY